MIVAGFGHRASATEESLRDALAQTGATGVDAIATPEDKTDSTGWVSFVKALGLDVILVPQDAIATIETPTMSQASQKHRQTGSVAEACALYAAGVNARLTITRQTSTDRLATCAIATSEDT